MTEERYRRAALDVIYLSSCAVSGRKPDGERVAETEIEAVRTVACSHLLGACVSSALESAGVRDEAFAQIRANALRKAVIYEHEFKRVTSALRDARIPYVPLKGAVLKELYPSLGMREMADIDILYDAGRRDDVRTLMEGLGYSTDGWYGMGVDDHFRKPPVTLFEMHTHLFDVRYNPDLAKYYEGIWERLISKEEGSFEYRFTEEDLYIYLVAHEYKHYISGGTGLRSLLDIFLFMEANGDRLDREYIDGELASLGLTDFEKDNRELAVHLFGDGELSDKERSMLDYILSSGAYGTHKHHIENSLAKQEKEGLGKGAYVKRRVFIPYSQIKEKYPLLVKVPVLIPFLPLYRFGRGMIKNRQRLAVELKTLLKHKREEKRH